MNTKGPIQDIYILTPLQEGLLFHALYDRNSSSYFEQISYRIHGLLDPALVKNSLEALFARHEVLRTAFIHEGLNRPVQVVLKQRQPDFYFEDISNIKNEDDRKNYVHTFKLKDRKQSFNMAQDPLMRISLLQLSPTEFEFIWSHHHILMDGWCVGILIQEYSEIYKSLSQGKAYHLPPVKPFKSYIEWLKKQDKEKSKKYWKDYLSEYKEQAGLPQISTSSVKTNTYDKKDFTFYLKKDTTLQLAKLAGEHNSTLNTIFQVLWGILIAKYNNTRDVVFGAVVSGRPSAIEGVETMIGLFINNIPVRIKFEKGETFNELLTKIQKEAIESEQYHYHPLAEIQSESELRHNLFNHYIAFENHPVAQQIETPDEANGDASETDLSVSNVEAFEQSNYDLNLTIAPGEQLLIQLNYNANIYESSIIENVADHFNKITGTILANAQVAIDDINILSEIEILHILGDFNNTATEYPRNKTIQELFEEQVLRTPKATALVYEGKHLTYEELNDLSNRLANYLRKEFQIQPDDLLGLLLNRSDRMIIAILGILKAGGAYVPVDPGYPANRKSYLLQDAGVKVLLTDSDLMFEAYEYYQGPLFALDIQLSELEESIGNPEITNKASDLAYIMYTSGSTGEPKGVAVEHRSVVRLVRNTNYVDLDQETRLLQTGALTFDATTFEMWGMLLNGGALHLLSTDKLLNIKELSSSITSQEINMMWLTASWFNELVDADITIFAGLKCLLVGGDKLSPVHINKVRTAYNQLKIVNGYGPTENTTFSICHNIVQHYENAIPIGKPIANSTAYILDENQHAVPVGVTGEIYLGGDGLARGYWNRAELTGQKFIILTLANGKKERLYKTGDLGRYLPDGTIEFKGRKDNQVKIRGYRIEQGEIENCLQKLEGIEKALVIAKEEAIGEKHLIAYFTGDESLEPAVISAYLADALPAYMIPAFFIRLESFPLTVNGKVDYKALPDSSGINLGNDVLIPVNETEKKLINIWKEVLNKEKIETVNNFFSIGGDSIKAIRLVSIINKQLGTSLEIKDLFNFPEISSLANYIISRDFKDAEEAREKAAKEIDDIKKSILENGELAAKLPSGWEDLYPMSDIEEGMIYHSMLDITSGIYHDQLFFQIEDEAFSFNTLENAFKLLVEKHPILRTSFNTSDFEMPLQIVHKASSIALDTGYEDISFKDSEEQKSYLQGYLKADRSNPFDITRAGLWRLRVFRLTSSEYGILWVFHHAILDGWSEASLRTELSNVYYNLKNDQSYKPKTLKASYKDFVIDQIKFKQSSQALEFWKNELFNYKRTCLPFNKSNNIERHEDDMKEHALLLDENVGQSLIGFSEIIQVNIKEIFLAAFSYLIKLTTKTDDITIGLVSNTRPEIEDGDEVLGCFLNTIPLRFNVESNLNGRQLAQKMQEKCKQLKSYDKLSLSEIIKTLKKDTVNQSPIYDILFNYTDFHVVEKTHEQTNVKQSLIGDFVKNSTLFSFNVSRIMERFVIKVFYPSTLYRPQELTKITEYYEAILKIMLRQDVPLKPEDIISEEAKLPTIKRLDRIKIED